MANTLFIDVQQGKGTINKHIYGHFAEHLGRCIYEGFWVGEDSEIPNTRGIRNDVVEALKQLNIPNLRWPGGCFADEYHWMDGIGPREERPSMVNTHWGGVTENNHFGTHEFFDLCEMLGADAYVCGNVGSGSVHEMAQWVEYCCHDGESPMANLRRKNGREEPWKLPYFGVGNESWGCGGNMRPEFYADAYRLYQTYVRNYGGQKVFKIACGANDFNFQWTEVLMERAGNYMNGLSLHYYTVPGPWEKKGSATEFGEDDWYLTIAKSLRMDEIVTRHSEIMDKYDPQKRVSLIVDEWGTWFDVEPSTNPGFLYQQNTLRDAFVAGITLNIFNEHCDRVHMANIAQTINVLQSMILTDGAKIILTPTYHVFEMWKVHQNATLLPIELKTDTIGSGENKIPAVHSSASKTEEGVVNLTLCHTHPTESTTIEIELGGNSFANVAGRILTASELNTHNTFDAPATLEPRELSADEIRLDGNRLTLRLPAASLVVVSCTP